MTEKELALLINEIPLDLRVEVVVSDILNSGYTTSDIFVKPIGLFERRFNKDIDKAVVVDFDDSPKAVFVKTHREGLYDGLPQSLFHNQPGKGSKAFKKSRTMVEEYKQRLVEEADARKFFSAYEVEFFRQRIVNEMQESKLIEAVSYSMNDAEILSYWRLPGLLDKRQKGILFYLFPVFNKIRGNTDYLREIYRLILGQPIEVFRDEKFKDFYFDNSDFTLGKISLAVDAIVGEKVKNYYPFYNITIGPLNKEAINDFAPGGSGLKIIDKLNGFFIPLHCDVEVNVITEKSFWVLDSENKTESRLGYSLWI